MKKDGLCEDDLFTQCVFRQDEREMVLKAVRVIQPDYQPCLNLTTSQCSSPLVQDFYSQVPQANFEPWLSRFARYKIQNNYFI